MKKVLHLVLKGKWYDMIASGEKKEEYRELKPYWEKRLLDYAAIVRNYKMLVVRRFLIGKGINPLEYSKGFSHVCFHRGYTSTIMTFEIENITIGKGRLEWGAPTDEAVFIIKLGKRT